MKDQDREYVFAGINRICQSLISEAEVLCELIDDAGVFDSVSRRIASLEDEADDVKHELNYYYQENKLFKDQEAMLLLDLAGAVEDCTDLVDDVCKTFIRLNITEIKDSVVSCFISVGTGAVKMTELMNSVRHRNKVDTPVKDIIELDHYKVEYRKIYNLNMKRLYVDGADPLEVMRWTAVYDSFMELFDAYEHVAESCGKYCIFSI